MPGLMSPKFADNASVVIADILDRVVSDPLIEDADAIGNTFGA